ncbi:MAG TPA: S4 domain-containing protein [candidate division Zixibacteria bacterium]|mgnify:CR=1 FL=1|nr:RNA-binding S4 domain-containing protein [candidate division Zixibacteria bacterium]MDD4918979.1 S4 domain-containing protein [candidate division Zixibacteria bacterium]MDM7972916.1 S4 domain-containing protein [candidate division Zixibacteria bacterium]HOD67376.1 S4 domain-containing protein [candidate division Zixibacteria bacterium]HOZ07925.1 S4 domain-containing protein [candidate division Zixibacteria bacterium]
MRIDDYLSTVGVVRRRTVAKELGQNGLVTVNGQKVKPAYQVRPGDVIHIKGSRSVTVEVIDIPSGSVPKEQRERYYRIVAHP